MKALLRALLCAACCLSLVPLASACSSGSSNGSTSTNASPTARSGLPGVATTGPATAPTAPPAAGSSSGGGVHHCGDDPNAPAPSIARIQRTGQHNYSKPPEMVIDPKKSYTATITTTKGNIVLELAAKDVPNGTNNFVFLACAGFYDGLTFHRVVPNFVIQGGDPLGNGTGDPGYKFNDEISPKWKHTLGALAYANSGKNTNGSQFYITLAPQPSLDGGYTVFGRVTSGQDVVESIRVGDKMTRIDIEEK